MDLTKEQIEIAMSASEQMAFELIKEEEWGIWFGICDALIEMTKNGYVATTDNLKFVFATVKIEQHGIDTHTELYWKAWRARQYG